MKVLAELSEKSLGINSFQQIVGENFKLRKSARAIILNSEGLMALQHIQKYNFHKLPGGGMEEGEDIEDTLTREIKEEVGCGIGIVRPIGIVIEYHKEFIHISYCFAGNVVGVIEEPRFDALEIENNQQTIWLRPSECLDTLKNDLTTKKMGDFILHREIAFVSEFLSG